MDSDTSTENSASLELFAQLNLLTRNGDINKEDWEKIAVPSGQLGSDLPPKKNGSAIGIPSTWQ